MEGEDFTIKMEAITMVSGRTTKCMVGGNYIMKVEIWLMKETGLMMNFMDMEKSIMIIQSVYPLAMASTIQTLTY